RERTLTSRRNPMTRCFWMASLLAACQVEAVDPGSGLTKGGAGSLAVDPQEVPVVPNCMEGQFVRRSAGGWECVTASGRGTVTPVAAGAGLVGGPITTTGTLAVDFAGSGSATTVSRSDHMHAANDPWMLSGTNLYYMGGNVGIGTSTPSVNLDVSGT